MAETSNDDDVRSKKRSHADFTGDDGAGKSQQQQQNPVLTHLRARGKSISLTLQYRRQLLGR